MKARYSLTVSAFILLLTSACSFSPQAPEPSEIPLREIDLYYNRASLNDVSFEQFKLAGSTLLAECGTLAGGRHSAKERRVMEIDEETLDKAKQEAWSVRRYVDELGATFKEPGGVSNLFGSGKLTMKLAFESGKTSVVTSFDSIAEGTADKEAAVARLARTLREAAGGNLCGLSDFYGIEGSRNILKSS